MTSPIISVVAGVSFSFITATDVGLVADIFGHDCTTAPSRSRLGWSCRVWLSFRNLGRVGLCLWVVVSGTATFSTVVDRPTPSSSLVSFRRIVDAAAVERQWLPMELKKKVVEIHSFAVSPDVFYIWTISYSLSDPVCPCISSGASSPVVLFIRFLLVCCLHTHTAHLSDQRLRILVWPFEALYTSSC